MNASLFVAAARPTLAVDRLVGRSFKTPKVPCDYLKVCRDKVETDFQAVARHFGRRKRLPACRRTASWSRRRDKLTRGQLRHTTQSPPWHNVLSSCHAHFRPFCLLERRVPPGSGLAWVRARGVAKWHSVDRRFTWFRTYIQNICEFEWSFRSR